MKMPANLRTLGVGRLQEHAKEKFGKDISGTKPQLLSQLKELYETIDNTINEAVEALAEQDDPKATAGNTKRPAPGKTLISGKPGLDTPTEIPQKVELVPEVVPYQGANIHKWPDHVKWLLNEKTGLRWEATDALRERVHDLVPCTPPLEK
jgi:hypothetical protein